MFVCFVFLTQFLCCGKTENGNGSSIPFCNDLVKRKTNRSSFVEGKWLALRYAHSVHVWWLNYGSKNIILSFCCSTISSLQSNKRSSNHKTFQVLEQKKMITVFAAWKRLAKNPCLATIPSSKKTASTNILWYTVNSLLDGHPGTDPSCPS